MFLPGLLLGLISCWHRGILKTFISHPSILLLPTFTHFTFASSTKWCKRSPKEEGKEGGEEEEEGEKQDKAGGGEPEEPFIVFSPKFTLLNILRPKIQPEEFEVRFEEEGVINRKATTRVKLHNVVDRR